jgi:hypothetical protein
MALTLEERITRAKQKEARAAEQLSELRIKVRKANTRRKIAWGDILEEVGLLEFDEAELKQELSALQKKLKARHDRKTAAPAGWDKVGTESEQGLQEAAE